MADPHRHDARYQPQLDRDTEVYKAVRAHEVTLNEARASLERAVLAPLIALNGGAIVAFLTLLGALSKSSAFNVHSDHRALHWVALGLAGLAIISWAIGLFLAARAVHWASRQQGAINKAYRLMRERVEARISETLAPIVAAEERSGPYADCGRQVIRKHEAGEANDFGGSRKRASAWSTAAFLAGAAAALAAIVITYAVEDNKKVTTTTTHTTTETTTKTTTTGPLTKTTTTGPTTYRTTTTTSP